MQQDKFDKLLAGAQRLMLDENFNAKVEKAAKNFSGGGGGLTTNEFSNFERQAFGGSQSSAPETPAPVMLSENIHGATPSLNESALNKLPDAIRQSFMKKPPMTIDPLGGITSKLSKNNVITEQAPKQTVMPSNGAIDYSLIKTIIDESVRRQFDEMKSTMLNEGTIAGLKIKKGNKIRFVDTKGNIFEATLSLVKKAE